MYNQTTDKVQSLMITGAQYDQIMIWMRNVPNPNVVGKYYIKDSKGMGSYGLRKTSGSNNAYAVKKVFDFAGNLWEWTSEAYGANRRINRGGYDGGNDSNGPASYRGNHLSRDNSDSYGSRPTLYVK